MDGVLDELKKAQDAVHVELLATKAARHRRNWGVVEDVRRLSCVQKLRTKRTDSEVSFGNNDMLVVLLLGLSQCMTSQF